MLPTPPPVPGRDHLDARFEDWQAAGRTFAQGGFERCRFVRCVLTEARLRSVRFSDCVFDGCELSALAVDGCGFTGVRFENCRMMGIPWPACDRLTFSATFDGCILDMASFAGMRLTRATFTGCRLRATDLTGCDLTGARFPRCDMDGALLRGATLHGTDFGTAENLRFDPRGAKTRGTVVPADTAAAVVAALGLRVPGFTE